MAEDLYANIHLICEQLEKAGLISAAENISSAMAAGMSATEVLMAARHLLKKNMLEWRFPQETMLLSKRTIDAIDAALASGD